MGCCKYFAKSVRHVISILGRVYGMFQVSWEECMACSEYFGKSVGDVPSILGRVYGMF